jgi:putative DNA primase/helicase
MTEQQEPESQAGDQEEEIEAILTESRRFTRSLLNANVDKLQAQVGFRDRLTERINASRGTIPTVRLQVYESLADVQPEEVRWLWKNRIARGKLTILEGDPGIGKSYMLADITARLSTGKPLPAETQVEANQRGVCKTLLCADEDDWNDTIRPRHDRLGANLDLIRGVRGILRPGKDGTEEEDGLELNAEGIEALRVEIQSYQPSLVIIDPMFSYFPGGRDPYKAAQVQAALRPLKKLAQDTGVAIVIVRHLTKSRTANPLYAGTGSIAFTGIARTVLRVGVSATNPEQKYVVPVKLNLAPGAQKAFGFEIIETGLRWDDAPLTESLSELITGRITQFDAAKQFLLEILKPGPMHAVDVLAEGKQAGFGERTLQQAKKSLNIKSRRIGGRNGYSNWQLPDKPVAAATAAENGDDTDMGKVIPFPVPDDSGAS